MSESVKDLRAFSDEELIERHDNQANSTQVDVNYYLQEIARRDQDRQTKAMLSFTKWITIMTVTIMIFTIVNAVIAFMLINKSTP